MPYSDSILHPTTTTHSSNTSESCTPTVSPMNSLTPSPSPSQQIQLQQPHQHRNFRKFANQFTEDFIKILKEDILDLLVGLPEKDENMETFFRERWDKSDFSLLHGFGFSTLSSIKIYDFIFEFLLLNFETNKKSVLYSIYYFYFATPLPPAPLQEEFQSSFPKEEDIIKRPIHLTKIELESLFSFVRNLPSNDDVKYCFSQLWRDNAFLIEEICIPIQNFNSVIPMKENSEEIIPEDIVHDGSIFRISDKYNLLKDENCLNGGAGGSGENDFFSHKLKILLGKFIKE